MSGDEHEADDTDDIQRLAAVIAKHRTQTAIDELRTEGVYDADRSVIEWDADSVAIPVTAPPQDTRCREVVRKVGEPRLRDLDDHLRKRGWSDDELDAAPSSWAVVGSVVLVDLGECPRPENVGEALLELHGEADTVLSRGGISGDHREPDVTVIAGEGDTETIHTEHGTKYALDLAEVMFSPGNQAERARMGEVVDGGERVLDMFAGVGYFTLPMARAGANVTAIERNPTAFRYLVENAMLNDVSQRVQPYRADCRDVIDEMLIDGPSPDAGDAFERIMMGYYEAHEYLDWALSALASGGVLHMHEATPESLIFDRPIERLESAASAADRTVEILDTRRVKGYSEGVAHVIVDARIE